MLVLVQSRVLPAVWSTKLRVITVGEPRADADLLSEIGVRAGVLAGHVTCHSSFVRGGNELSIRCG